MTYKRNQKFWEQVRHEVFTQAQMWSCGSEGRMLFENLVENEDWRERCAELAPESRTMEPNAVAKAIVTNYFIGSF